MTIEAHAPQAKSRHLVVLRAGDNSLHRAWLAGPDRDFDLFISYYGQELGKYANDAEYHEMRRGPKWPCIQELLTAHPHLIDQYDTFWFPDDDIATTTENINQMFYLFKAFKLALAQPALTRDSYFSWEQVLQRPNYLLRYVRFVEVMVPIFSRQSLRSCLQTFSENRSGWGLDWVWPMLCNAETERAIAIIDAAPVKHTRPIGGELYKNNPDMSPHVEAAQIFSKYKIVNVRALVKYALFGGVAYVGQPWHEKLLAWIKIANGHRKFRRNQARRQNPTDAT